MKKSFFKISFITLICLFIFTISSYASTDYSIYDESSGKYHIEFSDSMKTSLGLPSADIPFSFDTDNLYYFLVKEADGTYYFFYNTLNFIEVSSDNSDFNGTYKLKLPNDSRFKHFYMSAGSTEWVDGDFYRYGYYTTSDLSSILVSSDDIHNNVTNNVIVSKTVYTEDSGEDGDNGDIDNSESSDFKYTSQFLDDYLEVGQSPFEAFKIIIDYYYKNYPDTITFPSSDLPEYGLLIRHCDWVSDDNGNYSEGEFFGYTIYFTSVPLLSDYTENLSIFSWPLYCFPDDTGEEPYYFYCHLTPEGLDFSSSEISQHSGNFNPYLNGDSSLYCMRTIIASNYDIYGYLEHSSQLVFQQPTLGKVTTLAPVVNKVEMSPVMTEIVQIVPLIIVVVVSLVGLRKALKMLLMLLNRS